MIECTECGFQNEDDDHFCGGCREPLQWTGRRVVAATTRGAVDETAAVPVRPGLVERVVDRLTGPGDRDPNGAPAVADPGDEPAIPPAPAEDIATTTSTEAAARAQLQAEQAEQALVEAEREATRHAEATDLARRGAEEARAAREEAERHAREESEAAERLRVELEAAQTARQEAEAELRRESERAEAARRAAEERRTESDLLAADQQRQTEATERTEQARREAEARLQAEREAAERAQAELERAEAVRKAAEARAQAEAEAAEAADRAAAEAERARLAAEAKAEQEAKAAEQARRAAALVARPKPPSPRERQDVEEPAETVPATTTGPAPVKPDRSRIRTRRVAAKREPTRKLRPDDLICGDCGEGNAPSRNFCRRCGHTLAEAEVVRRPWWRRLIPRRRPPVAAAGERPGRGGGAKGGQGVKGAIRGAQGVKRRVLAPVGKVTRVLMFAALGAAAVGLTFNPALRGSLMDTGGDLFQRVRGFVAPQYDPVRPIAAEASSARADQADGFCCAAENVLEFGNTWWHASDGGVGQSLLITLDGPTDIAKFGIIPGTGDQAVWAEHPRPRDVEVDFIDADGRTVATLGISDIRDEHESKSQIFDVSGAQEVTSVRVTITRVYGEGLDSDDVAVSEIRLFTRR